ncbi:MAG: lipase maturation factor family protein [Proteobacteria bacterium]|nr:lipase maturation factor family protein [Pseudomonadota bacterium]
MVAWVFLRLLALIYLAAFASLAIQVDGLLGSDGILPVRDFLGNAFNQLGLSAYWQMPTVFWMDASDSALRLVCYAGIAASLSVFLDFHASMGLLVCYALYLSLVSVGQVFTGYQWDAFLLESGFLALFLRGGSPVTPWLFRFLLFRFMFMGGVVKLASGDPAWRQLTALDYHFETQPLPSPLAWHAHHFPEPMLQFFTGLVFFIELAVPFMVFMPRKYRLFAAFNFVALQTTIILTGSYNFFNLLTIALCVFLLDEADMSRLLGARLSRRILPTVKMPGRAAHWIAGLYAGFVLAVCGSWVWLSNAHQRPVQPFYAMMPFASSFSLVNPYGPFAVMTTERREIVLEGSDDGQTWLAYPFNYKPGELNKPLRWNIPHQPRLDWQMWFAALGDIRQNPWLMRVFDKLFTGSPSVLALFYSNPFPDHPPRYLRASLYRYTFTNGQDRNATGDIWRREFIGYYQPEIEGSAIGYGR